MFSSSAICLLAVAILPYLAVAQDNTNTNSDWNTTDLDDDLLIGVIAGSVALFLIIVVVFTICCCCCLCPGMCGGFSCFGPPQREYYNDEPPFFEPTPAPLAPMPYQAPATPYYPEPEPQLPVVVSRPLQEPTYIVREPERERREIIVREPERRERVAYVVRGERDRRYESERRVVIATRGSRRDYDRDDDRHVRYVTTGGSRSFYDSPRTQDRGDYY